ncbi:hypothetical protein ABEW61_14630 [Paenibacillus amylolyticus]|uniref:hypothetical protein n=1 Tax=Paenibacillus amylolyticus TaxID=1451 RepID=UPI003D2AACCD
MNTYVIGMDGGGSHTRVAVADQNGKIVSYVQRMVATAITIPMLSKMCLRVSELNRHTT